MPAHKQFHAPPWNFQRTGWDQSMGQLFTINRRVPPPVTVIPPTFRTMNEFVGHLQQNHVFQGGK